MMDLNSVLLEGVIQAIKPKKDHTGHWVEIRNCRNKQQEGDGATHRFRVEVGANLHSYPPTAFTIGRRIRVVGTLRRAGRLGPFIRAEHVEFKAEPQAVVG